MPRIPRLARKTSDKPHQEGKRHVGDVPAICTINLRGFADTTRPYQSIRKRGQAQTISEVRQYEQKCGVSCHSRDPHIPKRYSL
ncbi:hypothetical protein VTK56DRAFT_7569 [Thermocarpiscus australiensis]